jgi:hypothetical protein
MQPESNADDASPQKIPAPPFAAIVHRTIDGEAYEMEIPVEGQPAIRQFSMVGDE